MEYTNYRWFFTSSGKLVIGGKSDSQNEEVVGSALSNEIVLHTKEAGSPFCIIKELVVDDSDIKEAAIFCACFGKTWKKKAKQADVHVFRKQQIYKAKGMKKGTFGIKDEIKKIKVELKLYLTFQEGKLRAVPFETDIAEIARGKIKKEKAAEEISKKLEIPVEEVMSALPADSMEVKWPAKDLH